MKCVKFSKLREAVIQKEEYNFNDNFKRIEEDLIKTMRWNGKNYKGTKEQQERKLIKYFRTQQNKQVSEQIALIESVEQAGDFKEDLVITVEWKKSRMWGSNPKSYTNTGFESESIGGCGYCKLSTATAKALNSELGLLKLMYAKKNRNVSKSNRELLGYGSGYGLLPRFEGGVGVSSHECIIEGLGLKMKQISNTSSTDIYIISKVDLK